MMFGGKKPVREPPVDRVRTMMRGGMSEKDIVRQLKAEGFSFGEIERALMSAVKAGAAPIEQLPPGPAQLSEQAPMPRQRAAPAPAYPQSYQPSPAYPSSPAYPPYEEYQPAPAVGYPTEEEQLQPEVIIEELVESVAEEKFEKFSADVKRLEDEIEKLRTELSATRTAAETKPAPEIPRELGDRMDSIEVRIGGLEKAFKQILPSLQENIQAISRLVSEKRARPQF